MFTDAGELLDTRLSGIIISTPRVYEDGRGASAVVRCPQCGKNARGSACLDVLTAYISCRHCGFITEET
jgi:predicted RNA-binding Zn-ribbon protein involved in translation (DUF1610 family)